LLALSEPRIIVINTVLAVSAWFAVRVVITLGYVLADVVSG